jgi:hypothetical protein
MLEPALINRWVARSLPCKNVSSIYCPVTSSDELPVARDGADDPIEVVGAWSDVTARKQQFAEARKSVAPPPDNKLLESGKEPVAVVAL